MCGRFTLTATPEQLQAAFPQFSVPVQMTPHFNIAPTQPIAVVPNTGRKPGGLFYLGPDPLLPDRQTR